MKFHMCRCNISNKCDCKPVRSNVTISTTSFGRFFFVINDVMCRALWRHLSSLPHQFSIVGDVGGGWGGGADSPVHVLPIHSSTRCPFIWINLINDVKVKIGAPKAARRQNLHKRMKTCALTAVHTSWTLIRLPDYPPRRPFTKYPLRLLTAGGNAYFFMRF